MGHPVPGRMRLVAKGGQRAADLLILAAQLLMLLLQLVIGFQRVAGLRVDVQIEHQLIQREVNCLYAGKQVLASLVIPIAPAAGANGISSALCVASATGFNDMLVLVMVASGGAHVGLSGRIQRRAVGVSTSTKAAHAPEGGRAPRCAASATGLITPVRGCDAVATTASPRHCAAAAS